tara:strand:- start:378 stop:917 length:540 start_codon:yes stop_codon:yes gene_type:complete
MREKKFFRDCPSCGKQVGHVTAKNRNEANAAGRICRSCSNKKVKPGVPLSAACITKLSASCTAYQLTVREAYTKMWGDKYVFPRSYLNNWAKQVRNRDNNTCQKCATKKTTPLSMHAHHIVPCGYFMARALDIDNGVTLCSSCHRKVHCELDKYTVAGERFTATDFINHYNGWKPNGSK